MAMKIKTLRIQRDYNDRINGSVDLSDDEGNSQTVVLSAANISKIFDSVKNQVATEAVRKAQEAARACAEASNELLLTDQSIIDI